MRSCSCAPLTLDYAPPAGAPTPLAQATGDDIDDAFLALDEIAIGQVAGEGDIDLEESDDDEDAGERGGGGGVLSGRRAARWLAVYVLYEAAARAGTRKRLVLTVAAIALRSPHACRPP